ncbi:hypothetical protein LF1_59330 [Rubripirellula obstinata]|uniref:Uncharacterized protein n=1 Tax=Rubripirellula obstinata TaxID=406547 RepID=A0A5B1C8D7_9BACT|nr:hypothetical protein LF1_59330 [Rubripirellula obstinata]
MKDCIYKWVTLMQPEVSFIFIAAKGPRIATLRYQLRHS